MNPLTRRVAAVAALAAATGLLVAPAGARAATLSVNCDAGGDLQAKIAAAASGSTILVKGTCVGNFQIVGKGLTLRGNPAATLDGNEAFRPLGINNTSAPDKSVHLIGLTVTGGVTHALGGAGILKVGGGLTLDRVRVSGNLASSSSAPITGGGIFSAGNLTLTSSTVSGNRARTTGTGGEADGGGIAVVGGNLTVTGTAITGNRATAVLSSGDAGAYGGGLYVSSGKYTLRAARVSGNRATASGPSAARAGGGGGYAVSSSFVSSVGDSAILSNAASAVAPTGFAGVNGSGLGGFSTVHVTRSALSGNVGMATGSTAGAFGGGVDPSGEVTLTRSSVNGNRLTATSLGGNARAGGGGVNAERVKITASTVSRNAVTATTSGAFQTTAEAGGVSGEEVSMTNSTVALNRVAAASPPGGASEAGGGGVMQSSSGSSSVIGSTIADNIVATTGGGATGGRGGGIFTQPGWGLTLRATIVANNIAATEPDCFGGPTSAGHNLIRNAAGCSFTEKSTDRVGKDPKLGILRDNGGPTQTMAFASTSPARNAIAKAACVVASDQRGVRRPQGKRCDIGAYERKVG
jgi:hypothetical protein